jgi:hypothetical protein
LRYSKYQKFLEECGLETVRRLAEDGFSAREIAERIGIDEKCFARWLRRYSDFAEAVAIGKSAADYQVVRALYKKATGYNLALNKTYKLKKVDYDPDTGKKLREYEEIATGVDETYVPADLRAGTFWLKNRQPDRWSDRPDKEVGDCEEEMGGTVELPEADSIDC